MEELLMNKKLFLFSLLFFTSCMKQSYLSRKLVIIDCQTQEMIPSAKIVFSSKDTTYHYNSEALLDTLRIKIVDAQYRIEVFAAGYKKASVSNYLTKNDTILTICLTSFKLDSINVNWDEGIISIEDSSGHIKSIRHKR